MNTFHLTLNIFFSSSIPMERTSIFAFHEILLSNVFFVYTFRSIQVDSSTSFSFPFSRIYPKDRQFFTRNLCMFTIWIPIFVYFELFSKAQRYLLGAFLVEKILLYSTAQRSKKMLVFINRILFLNVKFYKLQLLKFIPKRGFFFDGNVLFFFSGLIHKYCQIDNLEISWTKESDRKLFSSKDLRFMSWLLSSYNLFSIKWR